VLIFLDVECPVSQKTTRRIQALADEYAGQVRFKAIYPTQYVTRKDVERFRQTFALQIPYQIDTDHRVVNRYKATTTPEVFLLSEGGQVLYRGAVDNQFYKLGKYRMAPTEFYLKAAIEAALDGRPVVLNQVKPIGCLIDQHNIGR
jgi:thiol-disulfide isomerase/thioredoxin